MASIFTYQDEPPRLHSPWSTPGTSTPQPLHLPDATLNGRLQHTNELTKLEPERQDGPTEYKLHLLLRPRRKILSTSPTTPTLGPQQSIPPSATGASRSLSESALDRPLSQPSGQARQARLQQLTTQLLWRLQQSSPFHSSSNANLVLPVLPEATPRLGVPERPAKLLPGLEESQGALYEIGVADDGTLVGLVEDELQESLTNLGAMAASLGCTINVLRKVVVGSCEWREGDGGMSKVESQRDTLWVAEVLVYPDSRRPGDADLPKQTLDQSLGASGGEDVLSLAEQASTEQLRVTLVGTTTSGKSSLLGTLSTSTLDNGRGKSRLSLLKHRHEIASGITSSVAHELIGYVNDRTSLSPVINYASGNVSSWIDIHNLADRLVLLSDSPGVPRFAKSTLRSLISWRPSWTILCVAADDNEENVGRVGATLPTVEILADSRTPEAPDLSLCHLDLCLRLRLPLMVVITKMDLANKTGLRQVLAKLLSTLKAAGRQPVMLSNSPGSCSTPEADGSLAELQSINEKDQGEIDRLVVSMHTGDGYKVVPIMMTSAVTGSGMSKVHALLRSIPVATFSPLGSSMTATSTHSSLFHVDEVFSIPPSRVYTREAENRAVQQGVVLCGHVSHGTLSIGNILQLGPFVVESDPPSGHISQSILRSSSYCAERSHPERLTSILARSYQGETWKATNARQQPTAVFLPVRVVSLRTLRLPVVRMRQGETGTIGVEPISGQNEISLNRARKGMVLVDVNDSLPGYSAFLAAFTSSSFSRANSPPLVLGSHALVYVNSVRAAVRVATVALDDDHQETKDEPRSSSPEAEVFRFDSDDEAENSKNDNNDTQKEREIRISFRFVSTVEWMEVGDQVLVVPTVTAPGPVTGAMMLNVSGLAGLVGRVCEVLT
ncbi:uncharacterized protein Z518_03937 [Rhinocladiella mackenziei CBS 650.93]|uniref:Tr-type G domain-containing protein n=1 Tax=Rhinocladiella mackenziei CBS 650.93 TaxID=1442369 RepID=A0A0D2H6F5_9EURO|nr:uncharacterized protein Z518_03937 [Rhinocladiella mackenziei CBS 650.93]KIX05963.1 hypothetical protein Z518_03937 [Rhinocladiella mackenziei CBS 650.93]